MPSASTSTTTTTIPTLNKHMDQANDTTTSNTAITRRRAINSPSADERQSLLVDSGERVDGNVDDDHSNDDDKNNNSDDCNLTLMEQVVLMGMKDRQGYLSFMNDTISYVLRGCILLELALRRKIKFADGQKRPSSGKSLPERHIDLVDGRPTGEVLLDETMRLMRMERHSIGGWIDLLSGETWNPLKVNLQLKQVRERIAKGLVDKGVLRTERHSFYGVLDMACHPVTDHQRKQRLVHRVMSACTGRGAPATLRTVCLVSACHAANVIDSACLSGRSFLEREAVLQRADELLRQHAQYRGDDEQRELVAAVLTVFCRLDSLLY